MTARFRHRPVAAIAGLSIILAALVFSGTAAAQYGGGSIVGTGAFGSLDCNGFSPVQKPIKITGICADIRGFAGVDNANTWGGRFYDNGHYIGHDEPTLTFLSHQPRSGNNVVWTETLPKDPAAAPTVGTPGSDVTHWAELSAAPWFGMALCNPRSYPLLPCKPRSDTNAPTRVSPGGGSSILEVQFYPPGEAPFIDSISCDNSHWCAALTIDDLMCTDKFDSCNPNCTEPVNFAFIQRNGQPTGPPSPQLATDASYTPNAQTLLMNPGDQLKVHIWDPATPGGGHALKVAVYDMTTGQRGTMQASAANGYAATGIGDCTGRFFNYQPAYNTAARSNIVPWAALQGDVMTEYEIGHFTPCTSVSNVGGTFGTDPYYLTCNSPYESSSDAANAEGAGGAYGDAPCYPAGDTHGGTFDPNIVTGCLSLFAGGEVDFDGTSYWPDWPTGTTPTRTTPGSFAQSAPTTHGKTYANSYFQTDVALSESGCGKGHRANCTVPPNGPGNFYPYFSTITRGKKCSIVFGNVASGQGVQNYGKDTQYGHDRAAKLGYDEFIGKIGNAVC